MISVVEPDGADEPLVARNSLLDEALGGSAL
jgi:hypothetical protein